MYKKVKYKPISLKQIEDTVSVFFKENTVPVELIIPKILSGYQYRVESEKISMHTGKGGILLLLKNLKFIPKNYIYVYIDKTKGIKDGWYDIIDINVKKISDLVSRYSS